MKSFRIKIWRNKVDFYTVIFGWPHKRLSIPSIRSICQMENSYFRSEECSFPLDCCTTSETFHDMQIAFAWERSANYGARTFLLAMALNCNLATSSVRWIHSVMSIVTDCVGLFFWIRERNFQWSLFFILFINNSNNINITYTKRVSVHNTKLYYYPTALRRVQMTPKTSTNITRYLCSRARLFKKPGPD